MGKKSRVKARSAAQHAVAEGTTEVGPRQPCPCGSGRRYKACHGSAAGPVPTYVARPFAGIAGECDLIAMREIVAAATAPLPLRDGGVVGLTEDPGEGPRLQDLLTDAPLEVTVHDGFGYWVTDVDDPDGSVAASLESANAAAHPSVRLSSVEAAYWTDVGTREHLRWVLPYDEEPLLDALARLHAAGKDVVAEGSRFVGMFRAHGLLVPVWDLPSGTGAEALEEPVAQLQRDLDVARAETSPLTPDERAARNGLANRQLTLR